MGAGVTRSAGIYTLLGDAAALLGDKSPSATSRLILCMRNKLSFFFKGGKKKICYFGAPGVIQGAVLGVCCSEQEAGGSPAGPRPVAWPSACCLKTRVGCTKPL